VRSWFHVLLGKEIGLELGGCEFHLQWHQCFLQSWCCQVDGSLPKRLRWAHAGRGPALFHHRHCLLRKDLIRFGFISPSQGGTCGFLSLSGFDAVETSTECSGSALFSKPKAWASGSIVCPSGYVVMSWGPQFVKSTHTGGSGSTGSGDTVTSYRNKYHTCFKNG